MHVDEVLAEEEREQHKLDRKIVDEEHWLRFGVTEGGCWWLPQLLWFWDRLCLGSRGAAKLGKDKFAEVLGDLALYEAEEAQEPPAA